MTKSKSNALVRLPKEQRCQFLIGPVNSWFMPDSADVWTQPFDRSNEDSGASSTVSVDDEMDCDRIDIKSGGGPSLSYFVYGSIGCFCYGEIQYRTSSVKNNGDSNNGKYFQSEQSISSATVNRLIDIKEDNSRVACVRFLKEHKYPLVMILTESGSFLIHNCITNENLIHFKKSELINMFVKPYYNNDDTTNEEHSSKRAKFNVTQQINSCTWPNARNAFLGISLLREKTNLLFWLKFKNQIEGSTKDLALIDKTGFIESHVKLKLDLPQYANPICCMESAMLDLENCVVAIAMDDGLIVVVKVNLKDGQSKRVIKLARHNDQICSMSLYTSNTKKFPLGLLASVSRNGLTLVWDIENEFYFADYQASDGFRGARINWFSSSFLTMTQSKHIYLAVSNPESGISVLEMPENARSKIRLKDSKHESDSNDPGKHKGRQKIIDQSIRHHGLIFNMIFDDKSRTLMTTSLDGNQILWSCEAKPASDRKDKKDAEMVEVKPKYLYPTMANNSRTHMLRFNPIREDLIGAALGKAGVRFYKISNDPANRRFDMTPSCGIISRKIQKAALSPTSVAWHPSHEYRVAIGTIEGKVLRVDLTPNRPVMVESERSKSLGKNNNKKKAADSSDDKMDDAEIQADDPFGVEYNPLSRSIDAKGANSVEIQNQQQQQPKTDGVYSLCWGPNPTCPEDVSRLAIYAVGSVTKRLFIYYTSKDTSDKMINYLDEFHDQSLPEAECQASEVAWKSSMDLMALGTTTGKVIIVSYLEESHEDRSCNKLFRKLAVIEGPLGSSHIQCLAWHPTTDMNDARYYYLAASANESAAYVFSIKESLLVTDVKARLKLEVAQKTSSSEGGNEANQLCSNDYNSTKNNLTSVSVFLHKLDAHKKAITDIVWNPHESDQLATSSFDRCCYVWSLDRALEVEFLAARIISKFQARDRLFTLEWSLVDTDLIFTSGHDSSIWAWRPSENPMRTTNES